MAMIIIQLRDLEARGFTSENLVKSLSGKKLPLAGVSEIPYVQGAEILDDFIGLLRRSDVYYIVRKDDMLSLFQDSPQVITEINDLYRGDYIPLKPTSCKIIAGLAENVK